jgi:hypothetical protein
MADGKSDMHQSAWRDGVEMEPSWIEDGVTGGALSVGRGHLWVGEYLRMIM